MIGHAIVTRDPGAPPLHAVAWVVTQISSFQPVHIFKKQAVWGKQSIKLNAHLLLLIKPHHSTKDDNTNNDF